MKLNCQSTNSQNVSDHGIVWCDASISAHFDFASETVPFMMCVSKTPPGFEQAHVCFCLQPISDKLTTIRYVKAIFFMCLVLNYKQFLPIKDKVGFRHLGERFRQQNTSLLFWKSWDV